MIRLLDKEQQRKYSVLLFLESHQEMPHSLRRIGQTLGLSEYLLKAAINGLTEDLTELGIEDVIKQDQTLNTLQLPGGEDHLNSYLLNYYLQDSLGLDILLKVFRGEMDSVRRYSRKQYISSSVAYRWIQEITGYLADHRLDLLKEKGKYTVVGETRRCRALETELCFRGGKDPLTYGNLREVEVARKIYNRISEHCQEIPLSMERRLLLFLVIMIRDRNKEPAGQKIRKALLRDLREISWYPRVFAILREMKLSLEITDHLMTELAAYTLHLGLFEEQDQDILLEGSATREMTKQATTLLWGESISDLTSEQSIELRTSLDRIHFSIEYQAAGGALTQDFDWVFFKKNHPLLTQYCLTKLQSCQERGYSEIWLHRESLVGHYLLLLERYGCPELEKREVCVTIDFSYGRQFNEYVQNGIEKMANPFSLKVTQHLSNETDILLTDELVVEDQQMEIIRLSMMSAQFDWHILKKRLTECVERKSEKKYLTINSHSESSYQQA